MPEKAGDGDARRAHIHVEQTAGDVRGRMTGVEIHQFYGEIIVRPESIEALPPAPGEPPYKGLTYFTEEDAGIFFGRERLTARLVARLQETRFLALVGASGSGKSSLLRAGVAPALRRQNWAIHVLTPTADPLGSLATSLTRDDPTLAAAGELRRALADDGQALKLATDKLAARANRSRLLLVVDQFEETFTLCKEEGERQAFLDCLQAAAAAESAGTVLIGVRADFYDRCLQYEGLRRVLAEQQEPLGPMTEGELVRVIAEPAKRGGWQFVEGLVEQMLEDVGREPGRLPLLSHALRETWERRRGTVMTLAGYRAAGGVEGAIAHTADDALQNLPEQRAEIAKRIFLALTELGEGAEDTRRIAGAEELARLGDEEEVRAVIERLVRARLVTVDDEQVEVAHEALIRRWPRLREWLEDNRERLRFVRQLARDAQAWEELDRDPGALYRGARLARALEWRQEKASEAVDPLSRDFLDASREAVEREAREEEARRQRELEQARRLAEANAEEAAKAAQLAESRRKANRLLTSLVVALVVLVLTFIFVFLDNIQAEIARRQAMGEVEVIPKSEGYRLGTADPDGTYSELPEQGVTIAAFQIDKYEVSIGQYALCVQHADCAGPSDPGVLDNDALKNHPVTGVTAYEAARFCAWIGRRLPDELEWERAARGPAGRLWPWGDSPDEATDDMANVSGTTVHTGTQPVNSYPAGQSEEGVFNLVGNVLEWTGSYASDDRYDPDEVWFADWPTGAVTRFLVQRGGGYRDYVPTVTWRHFAPASSNDVDVGFRCAAEVE